MSSKLIFENATAEGQLNNGVTLVLKAVLGEHQGPMVMEAQLSAAVARDLGYRLLKAAADAEPKVPVFPPSLSAATNARDGN